MQPDEASAPRDLPTRGWSRRVYTLLAVAALVASASALAAWQWHRRVALPHVVPPAPWPRFQDERLLEVTTTVHWRKVRVTTTRAAFLTDDHVWRQMHFEDWDELPREVRAGGLDRLLARYGALVTARHAWPAMDAGDWDLVPQPVRAMAFVTMIEAWVEFYDVGASFDLPRRDVLRAIKAIAMSESWFDHRASGVNTDGSIDLGLGGASGFARRTIRRWYDEGRCDFTMTDSEYHEPWRSARFLAFWFEVMLQEARGDLPLAIRAWNWGIGRASTGAGAAYLATVERRRSRYFEGPSHSPTWRRLSTFRLAQTRGEGRLTSMRLPMVVPSGPTPFAGHREGS